MSFPSNTKSSIEPCYSVSDDSDNEYGEYRGPHASREHLDNIEPHYNYKEFSGIRGNRGRGSSREYQTERRYNSYEKSNQINGHINQSYKPNKQSNYKPKPQFSTYSKKEARTYANDIRMHSAYQHTSKPISSVPKPTSSVTRNGTRNSNEKDIDYFNVERLMKMIEQLTNANEILSQTNADLVQANTMLLNENAHLQTSKSHELPTALHNNIYDTNAIAMHKPAKRNLLEISTIEQVVTDTPVSPEHSLSEDYNNSESDDNPDDSYSGGYPDSADDHENKQLNTKIKRNIHANFLTDHENADENEM